MTDVISVTNLGKAYKQYPSSWARLAEWMDRRHRPRHVARWVLQNVTFSVKSGQTTGIVGVNGAGKSTLLKMIMGTTQPTTGTAWTSGRPAGLLELGMGYHPDFTGRQNALIAGQLLGHQEAEIAGLMPAIEEFAGIGEYMDRPVRVYSSGMQVRLAFSVATAIRPDVLIVDEALSVGDAAFRRKCFRRIEDYCAQGTTLLFVSHDLETVKRLCERALFLKDGLLAADGSAKAVCDEFERHLFGGPAPKPARSGNPTGKFNPALQASCETVYGNGSAEIPSCWLEDVSGRRINVLESGQPFCWKYRVRFHRDVEEPVFSMMIKTREGVALYGVDSTRWRFRRPMRAGDECEVVFDLKTPLAPGHYYFNCGVREGSSPDFLVRRVDTAILKINSGPESTVITGLLELNARFSLRPSGPGEAPIPS